GHPLLIPVDGLGLLRQGGDHAREGPGLRAQLVGRLVVLIDSQRRAPSGVTGMVANGCLMTGRATLRTGTPPGVRASSALPACACPCRASTAPPASTAS